jgi:putative transposase
MKLKMMAVKYGSKIIEVSPYLTSKNCHNCLQTNDNLGKSKLFVCENCNLVMDRDINASKNILLLLQCEKQGKRRPKCFREQKE